MTLGRGHSWDRRQSVYSKVTNNLWNSLALLLTIFHLPKGSWFRFRCRYDYNWIKFVRDKSMIQTQNRECLIFKKCQIPMSFCLCSHSRKRYLQISNLSPWGLWKFLVTYLYHLYINICSQVMDSSFLKTNGNLLTLGFILYYKHSNYQFGKVPENSTFLWLWQHQFCYLVRQRNFPISQITSSCGQ